MPRPVLHVHLASFLFLCMFLSAAVSTFAQVPEVAIVHEIPGEPPRPPLIGEEVTFTVYFENAGADAGYGPYLALCLPVEGADGKAPCDGATFVQAEAVFTNETIGLTPMAGPAAFGSSACGSGPTTQVDAFCDTNIPAFPTGCQLVILELPFGSFFPDQPPVRIDVTVEISDHADSGAPLDLHVRGGFRLGDQAVVGGSCITGPVVTDSIVPTVYTLEKEYLGPEDETATGESFPQTYEFLVNIADGQTLDPLIVEDEIPADLWVLDSDCPSFIYTGTLGHTLEVNFGKVTGTTADVDVSCQIEFIVPEVDLGGQTTVGIDTCEAISTNVLEGHGAWDPVDPRDPATLVDVESEPHELRELCLATQKMEPPTVVQDSGHPGPTPGDIVEYTIDFQVSDYVSVGTLQAWDTLPDGLELQGPLFFQLFEGTKTCFGQVDLGPTLSLDTSQRTSCGDGSATLHLDLSSEMRDSCSALANGVLTGGPPGTRGLLRFQARILDEYHCPGPFDDGFVDKHDKLINSVHMAGVLTAPTPGLEATDGSAAEMIVPFRVIEKKIIGRNGKFLVPGQTEFDPGDTVTFSISYTIPSGDAEAVRIEDFLPDPVFDVSGISGTPIPECSSLPTKLPADNEICYGPDDDLHDTFPAGYCGGGSSWSDPASNSLCFDYGDVNDPQNGPRTVEIRFTLELSDEPFADGLLLTNQVVETEQSSSGDTFQQVVIEQLTLRQPELKIQKGVVAACCPYELRPFDPSVELPLFARRFCDVNSRLCGELIDFNPQPFRGCRDTGCFTPQIESKETEKYLPDFGSPGSTACPRFDKPVTSWLLASDKAALNQDVNGVKPGDRLTFAIVAENVGSSSKGAFDLALSDMLPAGLEMLPSSVPCVTNGAGQELPNAQVTPRTNGGFDVEINDPPGIATVQPYDPTSGQNVIVVTFDVRVTDELAPGTCVQNVTELTSYAGVYGEDVPNHVISDPGPRAVAEICNEPAIEKSIVDTSATWTTDASGVEQVTIGEIIRFRLDVELPEGALDGVQLEDVLPPGFAPATPADVSLTTESNRTITFSPPLASPPAFSFDRTKNSMTFDLGRVTNADRDCNTERIVVEFNAQVLNDATNVAGADKTNSGRFSWLIDGDRKDVSSDPVSLQIVEPEIDITKTAELIDGDPARVRYHIQLGNVGDTVAFDVRLLDQLPTCLTPVDGSLDVRNAWFTGPGLDVANRSLDLKFWWLLPGASADVSFEATLCDRPDCQVVNDASVTWQSLSSLFLPQLGASTVPGGAGDEDGTRDGSGGVNDYFASASAAVADLCEACIRGVKFHDLDGNGRRDPGEPGLPGWTLQLWTPGADRPSATTGADGSYEICGLRAGWYFVNELVQSGWTQTAPFTGFHWLELGIGEDRVGVDFGNRKNVCARGVKYDDANGNGVRDAGETGLEGWIIQASCPGLGVFTEVVTARDGTWEICNPPCDHVTYCEEWQPGWQPTTSADGCHRPAGSDVFSRRVIPPTIQFGNQRVFTVTADGESAIGCDRINAAGTRVTLRLSGGSGNYRCDGLGVLQSSSADECVFVGMPFGTHTYEVSDIDSGEMRTITVDVPPAFELGLQTVDPSGALCNNGSASVSPTGSVEPYYVRWGPEGLVGQIVEGLSKGEYFVTVSDGDDCRISQSFTLSCVGPWEDWNVNHTTVYFRATGLDLSAADDLEGDLVELRPDFDPGVGLSLGVQRRIAKRWTMDLGALYVPVDTRFTGRETSEDLLALTLGLSYRLVDGDRFDLSVGPFLGYLDLSLPAGLEADGDFTPGLALAVDAPLGADPWGVSGALRYFDTQTRLDSPAFGLEVARDVSLLSVELGVSFSF